MKILFTALICLFLGTLGASIADAHITIASFNAAPLVISGGLYAFSHFQLIPSGAFGLNFSPQQKIQQTATKYGQKSTLKNQGTTRHIWDTLEVKTGARYYRFFEGVNTRTQPYTNLTDNKLEAGETLACQFMYLTIFVYDTETPAWKGTDQLSNHPALLLGNIGMELMNSIVMKPIKVQSFTPEYNRMPNSAAAVYKLFTNQVILPMIPFVFPLALYDDITVPAKQKFYLQLTIEGTGSILSAKGNL